VAEQADFSRETTRREKLKNWKETGVLLAKGARTPRESPNFQQKEEQTAQRKLQVVTGGEPAKVTHREAGRRGSRLRKGETRASRRESRQIALEEVENWQAELTAPVIRLEDWKQQHASQTPTGGPPDETVHGTAVQSVENTTEQHVVWTLDDFSEEALARDRERWERNSPSFEEARQDRRRMEETFEKAYLERVRLMNALLGRGCKTPQRVPPASPPSEDCVHHLNFESTQPSPPQMTGPARRPVLQGSHSRPVNRPPRTTRSRSKGD
jgi:hypothetical protein